MSAVVALRARTGDEVASARPLAAHPAEGSAHAAAPTAPHSTKPGVPVGLDGVFKAFGTRSVLRNFDLAVAGGEFVAVVGRSGGGKTTLLRLIAGLETPEAGRITIGGRTVAGLQRQARLLFQDARLLPWQTVLGNVGIARGREWRETALAALADVGLADRAGDWPAVLSGGQRQRVALARALVSRPGMLLLDEPFGALDALTRAEMHDLLLRLHAEHGFTVVLITHDVSEALALADRVVVLRDGAVALDRAVAHRRAPLPSDDADIGRLKAEILEQI